MSLNPIKAMISNTAIIGKPAIITDPIKIADTTIITNKINNIIN